MEKIALKLPYPVSANRYWRSYVPRGWTRAIVCLSDEAKSYRSEVGWIARAAGCHQPTKRPVALEIKLYPRDRRLLDLDNALKVLIDALKGIAYVDDRQVWRIVAERRETDGCGRIEVGISEFAPPTPEIFSSPGKGGSNDREKNPACSPDGALGARSDVLL